MIPYIVPDYNRISVIVPTYNRTRLLMDRCIPSILAQTDPDWECHVVGDGTEPETVEAMTRLCLIDSRFRFTNLRHAEYPANPSDAWGLLGLEALNWGLDHAEGDWIAVLADDDEWTPDHNAELLRAALMTGVDHVYGVSETFKGNPPVNIKQRYGAWPPGDGQFCNGANLYRASLPYRYALDCQSRGRTGDADLWIRMVEGGVRFHFIDKVVHHYFRHWP